MFLHVHIGPLGVRFNSSRFSRKPRKQLSIGSRRSTIPSAICRRTPRGPSAAGHYSTSRVPVDLIAAYAAAHGRHHSGPGDWHRRLFDRSEFIPSLGDRQFLRSTAQGTGIPGPARLAGMENTEGGYRLLLMNLFLHGINSRYICAGDTLSPDRADLPRWKSGNCSCPRRYRRGFVGKAILVE